MVMITIQLPQAIEDKARELGILTEEKIARLIEAEIERQREEAIVELRKTMALLSADFRTEYGHLSEEEALAMIDQWIDEVARKALRDKATEKTRQILAKLDALAPQMTEVEIGQALQEVSTKA